MKHKPLNTESRFTKWLDALLKWSEKDANTGDSKAKNNANESEPKPKVE